MKIAAYDATIDVGTIKGDPPLVMLDVQARPLTSWSCVNLTPAEARGLANRLLREAAEVEFATNCTKAADGGES